MREGKWETAICIFLAAMIAACVIQTIQLKSLGILVRELSQSTGELREQRQVLLEGISAEGA